MGVVAWSALSAAIACLLAVGVLAQSVRRLRSQVDSLSGEVSLLRVPPETERGRAPTPPAVSPVAELAPSPLDGSVEDDVPVIMSEPDEVDLSTARVASVTLAGPLIKVAALPYGVRRALTADRRMRIAYAMRTELRRQRKMRRRRRAERAPSEGWRP